MVLILILMVVGQDVKKMKVLGLIPLRMESQRLPAKSLLPISGLPLVIPYRNKFI